MNDKTLSDLLKFLYKTPYDEYEQSSDSDVTISSTECSGSPYKNIQIFTDHVVTTKRFQKTLYYGELSHSNFHPPFALTDATLELFNKTVPNTGRLDILTMDYAASVSRAVCISPYSMVLAMMYLEQLRHKNPDYLESVSPCELFVISVLVASKYLFDNDEEFTYNCDWAEAANMEVQDLNRLEKDFLDAIKWELFTTQSDFFSFLFKIEQRIAAKGTQKGWLSYTDMYILSSHKLFLKMWMEISGVLLKVVLVVTVGYVAAVVVVFAAFSVSFMYQKPAEKIIQKIMSSHPSKPSTHQHFSKESAVHSIIFTETYKADHQNIDLLPCSSCSADVECLRTECRDCILPYYMLNTLQNNCSVCGKKYSISNKLNDSHLQPQNDVLEPDFMFMSSEKSVVFYPKHNYSTLQT